MRPKIFHFPNRILTEPEFETAINFDRAKKYSVKMFKAMRSKKGVKGIGLAANQIGIPYPMFVMNVGGN
jgi:peptide deformylase